MFYHHADDLWAAFTALALWVFAQTAELPPMIETALENSAWAGLVFFFVWTTWKREDISLKREERLGERIQKLENQTPELLERVLASMDRNSDVVTRLNDSINKLQTTVEETHE